MVEVLRTPDECFDGLPDYDFAPHHTEVTADDGTVLRFHHIDEGPRDAHEIVLCMHGEPSWAYLYRKMIPVFVAAGRRVIAPDLPGPIKLLGGLLVLAGTALVTRGASGR